MRDFTLKERKRKAEREIRELLELEPVSLVVKKGRLIWLEYVKRKDDDDG